MIACQLPFHFITTDDLRQATTCNAAIDITGDIFYQLVLAIVDDDKAGL